MTIYDLLKNSSPSMARHFKESEEGTKKNTEDITALKTRVTTLEDGGSGGSITPFEKIIDSSIQFEKQTKIIANISYEAYYVRINVDTTTDKFTYNPLFCPRCPLFMEYAGVETSYTEIPMLDYDNNEIFKNQDYSGFAISRNYNTKGFLQHIDLLITKEVFDSLSQTSTGIAIRYKLYA